MTHCQTVRSCSGCYFCLEGDKDEAVSAGEGLMVVDLGRAISVPALRDITNGGSPRFFSDSEIPK